MAIVQILILVGINIFLGILRRWLVTETIGRSRYGWKVIIISLVMSLAFAVFPWLSILLDLPALHYTQIDNFGGLNFWLTVGIALIALFVVLYLILRLLPTKGSLILHLLFVVLLIGVRLLITPFFPSVLLLRVVVACLEEWLKSGTSTALRDKYHLVSSDILLFGILSALGFAFLENIIYLIKNISILDTHVRTTIATTGGLIIKRSISARVMHICYTGLIVRGIYQAKTYLHRRRRLPLGIFLGVGLHFMYNMFIIQTNILAIILLLLLSYFFLARLLYRSDRLYLPNEG